MTGRWQIALAVCSLLCLHLVNVGTLLGMTGEWAQRPGELGEGPPSLVVSSRGASESSRFRHEATLRRAMGISRNEQRGGQSMPKAALVEKAKEKIRQALKGGGEPRGDLRRKEMVGKRVPEGVTGFAGETLHPKDFAQYVRNSTGPGHEFVCMYLREGRYKVCKADWAENDAGTPRSAEDGRKVRRLSRRR